MLDVTTKGRINSARDMLVGKVPNPISQVQQITFALIYKFMNDMDKQSIDLGGEPNFFKGKLEKYSWDNLISNRIEATPALELYSEGLEELAIAEHIPLLFRKMFKNAFIPYKDGVTFKSFIKVINEFDYKHSEKLGDAFEFLLSVLGSQGDAGQFRTPRHIIDFMVELMNPQKHERVLDPACGTAGFLISAYKHILKNNSKNYDPAIDRPAFEATASSVAEIGYGDENKQFTGDKLKGDEKAKLDENIFGYDISPEMVQFSLVNFYLHQCKNPQIHEYDSLTSTDRWGEYADVVLANPPFMTPKGGIRPHDKFGVKSNRAEVLFVDYIAEHLTLHGRAAIIVPEGVIFQSGIAYKDLRKNLIENNFLVGVISLPAGIFNPYSGVKTSILWLDRGLAAKTDKVFFAKITADGFDLGAQRRPNNKNDLPAIFRAARDYIDALSKGKSFEPASYTNTTIVEKAKIAENGEYNFSADRYLEAKVVNSDYPLIDFEECIEKVVYTDKIKSSDFLESGKFPIIDQSDKYIAGYWNDEDSLFKIKKPLVIFGDHTRVFKYIDFDFVLGADGVKILQPADNLNPKFFYYMLKSLQIKELGYSRHYKLLKDLRIPLPPLEVQQEIVAEIEGYQTIIDAARKITTTYKPRITIQPDWPVVALGEVISLEYGKPMKRENRIEGEYPVYGSNGVVGTHNEFLIEAPAIIVGRKGSAGAINYSENNCFPIDTTFYANILDSSKISIKFLYYQLLDLGLDKLNPQAAIPGLNRNDAYSQKIPLPPLDVQKQIVEEIEAEQKIIDSNKKLIELFEAKIHRTISKIWGDAETATAE